ncbi:MAG: 2'-5' RNA ligase [Clostridia bacterium]|nr:2'-5' RNA ligase [Clostridia bacterium]
MPEHCGYVVKVEHLRKHSNADRLQVATFFGNDTVVSLEVQLGQMGVYFPCDLQLSEEFCAANDLVRRKDENGNPAGGYLEPEKRNIKAIKLRGEKSDGMFLPITCLASFGSISELKVGDIITIFNGVEICRKYIPRGKHCGPNNWVNGKRVRKPTHIAPTFYEHVDTAQLAYNLNAFKAGDIVELSLKMHGTSARTGYLPLHKRAKRTIWDKILRRPGREYTEYGYVTGTRRVVLDDNHDGGYYDDNNFRLEMAKKFEGKLHKGEVVYYEIVGFVNKNTPIMASVKNSKIKDKEFSKQYGEETVFSYGCDPEGDWEETSVASDEFNGNSETQVPRCEVYVYRMTSVNEDGDVVEMSPDQVRYRCEQMGVKTVPVFERFIVPDICGEMLVDKTGKTDYNVCTPGEFVLRKVEQYYDGPDPIGKTHIREGVVARIVNRPNIAVYKAKNWSFRVLEGIIKDEAEEPDMEEAQEFLEEN